MVESISVQCAGAGTKPVVNANVPSNGARLEVDPATTSIFQNGTALPAIFYPPYCDLVVSISLQQPVVTGMRYTLTGSFATFGPDIAGVFSGSYLWNVPANPSSAPPTTFQVTVSVAIKLEGFVALNTIYWELRDATGFPIGNGENTSVEIYFLPQKPVATIPSGLPAELLRAFTQFASDSGWHVRLVPGIPTASLAFSLDGIQQLAGVVSAVTADEQVAVATLFCFSHNPPAYDTDAERPGYLTGNQAGNQGFKLLSWANGSAPTCNCEDTTAALWMILTTLFGLTVTPYFIGFSAAAQGLLWTTAQNLLGIQNEGQPLLVNNPQISFPLSPHLNDPKAWVIGGQPTDTYRTGFANHRFCRVDGANNVIADATIGPFAGAIQLDDYLSAILQAWYPAGPRPVPTQDTSFVPKLSYLCQ